MPITSPNINRFSKFFHWQTRRKICDKFVSYLSTPDICCYTTLWNMNVRKLAAIWNMHCDLWQITRYHSQAFKLWWVTSLQIYQSLCRWKNFLNLWTFGEVTGKMVDHVICPIRLKTFVLKEQNSLDKLNNLFITDRNCYWLLLC